MPTIKHIFLFFVTLFLFISNSSNGNINTSAFKKNSSHQQKITKEYSTEITGNSFIELEGVLQPSVRSAQTSLPVYQNLKGGKKNITHHFLFNSYNHSTTLYDHYFVRGLNNFTSYPFYIAYHRLII